MKHIKLIRIVKSSEILQYLDIEIYFDKLYKSFIRGKRKSNCTIIISQFNFILYPWIQFLDLVCSFVQIKLLF